MTVIGLSDDVALAVRSSGASVHTVVAGLGGRPVTRRSVASMLEAAGRDGLEALTLLDLDLRIVDHERARITAHDRPGAPPVSRLRGRVPTLGPVEVGT